MNRDAYNEAKENLKDRLEFRGDKLPSNRLGWWLKLHFTDDGQFALEEVTNPVFSNTRYTAGITQGEVEVVLMEMSPTAPEQPPAAETDQSPLPPSQQLGDQ